MQLCESGASQVAAESESITVAGSRRTDLVASFPLVVFLFGNIAGISCPAKTDDSSRRESAPAVGRRPTRQPAADVCDLVQL